MRMYELFSGVLLLSAWTVIPHPSHAQDVAASKYPLRLHVLAIDQAHPTVRLQPNWCSGSVPASAGGDAGAGADQGGPCGGSGNTASFGGEDDFSGGGRADLVTPPSGTQALNFTYEGCPRVRVAPGFHALAARWKKPGKLEVLVPSDEIVRGDRPLPTQRCTFTITLQEFVYLRLRDGSMRTVSQEAYLKKPSLRVFLSGGPETLHSRVPQTISVKQLVPSPNR